MGTYFVCFIFLFFNYIYIFYILFCILGPSIILILKYFIVINYSHSYYTIDQLHLIIQYLQFSKIYKSMYEYISLLTFITLRFWFKCLPLLQFFGSQNNQKNLPWWLQICLVWMPLLCCLTLQTNNSTSPTSFLQAMLWC